MKNEIIEKSLDAFPDELERSIKTYEEIGELMQALSKYRSNPTNETAKDFYTEICDVRMALDQWEARLLNFGLGRPTMDFIQGRQLGKLHKAIDEVKPDA